MPLVINALPLQNINAEIKMDSNNEQNGTQANTSVPEPEWPVGIGTDGMPKADPRIVEKLVEELKSQGMFDQIRKDCLAEGDTKVNIIGCVLICYPETHTYTSPLHIETLT